MGPGFGRAIMDDARGVVYAIIIAAAVAGAALYEGCSYVRKHVDVEWKP